MAYAAIKNKDIARILYEISIFLEMDDIPFKPAAYEKAAYNIDTLENDVSNIYKENGIKGLMDIPAVGKNIAEKIEELLTTGKLEYYQELKKKFPVEIEELKSIEGVGPKTIKILYEKLGIRNVEELEKAAKIGKIQKLEGFGEKTEQKILRAIAFRKRSSGRFLLADVLDIVREIEGRLRALPHVDRVVVAGSIRRWKETVGDADILVASQEKYAERVMDYFTTMPEIANIQGKGKTKSSVKFKNGLNVDLRVVDPKVFGSALNYFTGNKDHNVALRIIAKDRGMKLSEYGLFRGTKLVAGKTEEEIYKMLGMQYIEPELRENTGEIDASAGAGVTAKLPHLIGYNDLLGDLQVQTNWTDGADSIKEMADYAKKAGLQYIVITDHTRSLAMTGGLDEAKLAKQAKEIDRINKEITGITILKGAEVNILKDGSLDISNAALQKLDVVGAAVHSNFNMPIKDMTARILSAMENPNVDILFHPTGRIINRREPYAVDIDSIIDAAKNTGTILEIDGCPSRLDLKDECIKRAIQAGCLLCIDSDAHSKNHFRFLEFGIAQARRGWAEKKNIVNTRPLKEFLRMLKDCSR